jgi:signal peptidase II
MESGAERRLYWSTGLVVLASDIVTKFLAERELLRSAGRAVLGDWLQLRLVYNPGAAFGLNLGPLSRWIFMGVAVAAVFLLFRYHRMAEPGDWFRQLALGLVSGGALGNLVDRVRSSQGGQLRSNRAGHLAVAGRCEAGSGRRGPRSAAPARTDAAPNRARGEE